MGLFTRKWLAELIISMSWSSVLTGAETKDNNQEFALPSGFSGVWYDGNAEVSSYQYQVLRYGEWRTGTSVAIFVTEPFNFEKMVKSNSSKGDGIKNAMKLNLIKDFPTGIYDYNIMMSVFSGIENGAFFGVPVKVTFSSQEWCGHVWQQTIHRANVVSTITHSYFEDEEQDTKKAKVPQNVVLEDAVFLWARGFTLPMVALGEIKSRKMVVAANRTRFAHKDIGIRDATFTRAKEAEEIDVSSGKFRTNRATVTLSQEEKIDIWVEEREPHRIIKWIYDTTELKESGELMASERLPYWQMNKSADLSKLNRIGLKPRPVMTP